ncbi:CBL-interacting serine/threonine-protein kinase 23 [Helianthus annuus]|uniref:CBL-interacting serine/threonine-protein kinase 23 n=1 Tax=Helianthus annuus TaxID=4232 RepID=UPI000B8F9700|nr:CBL-interacting serine/threonine-protein kinase 23 [Helianthus annuus]
MFVATGNEYEPSSVQWSQLCRHFEFHEILSATKNFDESLVIGRGGFGKVYKGNIKNGSTVVAAAIKRLDTMSNQGASEFWAEVEMLSKLRHCHLVSLIGYCMLGIEMILVYEYMPRGTLADHLHKLGTPLSWCQRLKICIGAARGLDYLHTGTGIEFGVIHRDVKSSNILLDESWAAKVSDFGLSIVSPKNQASTYVNTLVKGTFGYIDPNYFATGKLTRKSDVYAFGVVLLEVICRKRAVDNSLDCGIATWAQDSIKAGRLKGIVDSDIRREISTKCLKQFAKIAERCLDNYPKNRPTMAEVVLSLEYVLTLQEKTYNLSQTASKTIFGRMVDKFSFSDSGQNSGMDIGSFMSKKPYMNLGSLTPKRWKQLTPREKIFQKNGALLLEDKLKSGVGSIKIFQAEELEKATMNFAESMIIERGGGTGIVYKGILSDNRVVAIKRSRTLDEEQVEPFMNEILILGQINHRNVVQLLGCCLETEVPLLVCEFVSSYNLYHHIHHNTSSTGRFPLDSRLRIAHESAGALAYLHSDATTTIIHRDVKSANILLDENYTAKVADFGASKSLPLGHDQVFTVVYGTLGYMDPEYMITGQLTDKSDVYSFGVVLAELLTGLKPIDEEDKNLATVFVQAKRENRLREIVDHQVLEEVTDEQLDAACNLVCRCLDREGQTGLA